MATARMERIVFLSLHCKCVIVQSLSFCIYHAALDLAFSSLYHETTQKRHEPSYLLNGNSKDGDHSWTYQITRDTCTYPAGSTFLTTFLTFELNEVRAWLCVVESRGGEREPGYGVKCEITNRHAASACHALPRGD